MKSYSYLAVLAGITLSILGITLFYQFTRSKSVSGFSASELSTGPSGNSTDKASEKDSLSTQPPKPSQLWQALMDIEYTQISQYGYQPTFQPRQEAFEGKEIQLEGFMYPLQEGNKHSYFILSYFPVSSCFFCGGAGPESVVEVNASDDIAYTGKRIQVRGKLVLNREVPERLFYILEGAKAQ
ncbi:MAG: hypothetical protein HC880_15885 [Bacteroidia bacterium]|nr:hypothetical protein [Bacteroidia bacterium]